MMNPIPRILGALAVAALLGLSAPVAEAQQVNPTGSSVTEEQLFQSLQGEQAIQGRVSIPDGNAAALIRPGNPGWAGTHNGNIRTITIWTLIVSLAAVVLFLVVRGKIRIDSGFSGIRILRFTAIERFAHWLMAGSFIVLALTGLNLVFGRSLLLPLVGESNFGALSAWGKLGHNYMGWAFMVGLALSFVLWVARNIPRGHDVAWLMQGGGLLSKGKHPPAGKFNAGQKLIFWAVMIGGAALSYTGFMLLFPAVAGTAADWQFYQLIHGVVSAILTAIIVGHIYLGSVGMEGAFDAMGSGEVDENWAKEHHALWVEEMKGNATRANTAATPAE
jgi:formate dehydrogenase subunit gamma